MQQTANIKNRPEVGQVKWWLRMGRDLMLDKATITLGNKEGDGAPITVTIHNFARSCAAATVQFIELEAGSEKQVGNLAIKNMGHTPIHLFVRFF